MTRDRCQCSHPAHLGRCPLLSCGCTTYRPVAPEPAEDRCSFSDLPKSGCAHCRPATPAAAPDRLTHEDVGPRFTARYDGECGACAGPFEEGATIAALLVMGGYACSECLP